MSKQRRRKARRQYQDPANVATARTLAQVGALADSLQQVLDGQLSALVGKVLVLEEALEMNFWVQLKLVQEGVLVPGGDPQEIMDRAQALQQEYLATVAIASFLEEMGYRSPVEEP